MRNVLVINANPKPTSLCQSMANHYAQTAAQHHNVKQLDISQMEFAINLQHGYDHALELEPDLVKFQQLIEWSEHVVIISPVWWGTVPAKFKGIIDRTFLPNFAFKYVEGKSIPKKLLKGRTSELIITLDSPPFWYKYIKGNAIYKQLKHSILDFAGFSNRKTTYFGPVISSSHQQRERWLNVVSKLASQSR